MNYTFLRGAYFFQTNFNKVSETSIKFEVEYEFVQEVLKLKETCGFGVLIDYD